MVLRDTARVGRHIDVPKNHNVWEKKGPIPLLRGGTFKSEL